jgi:hypothetical protein
MSENQFIKIDKRTLKQSKLGFVSPKEDYKQYMKDYQNQIFKCTCGLDIKIGSKLYHLKSKKHNLFEEILNNKN